MASLYYEEMNVGQTWVSSRRTITEADVVLFGSITGDQHPMHFDEEFCKQNSPFKTRIAHGMLGITYAIGLLSKQDFLTTTGLALLGYTKLDFKGPIKIGDTLTAKQIVLEKKDGKRGGIVKFSIQALNQRGELITDAEYSVLVAKKPA